MPLGQVAITGQYNSNNDNVYHVHSMLTPSSLGSKEHLKTGNTLPLFLWLSLSLCWSLSVSPTLFVRLCACVCVCVFVHVCGCTHECTYTWRSGDNLRHHSLGTIYFFKETKWARLTLASTHLSSSQHWDYRHTESYLAFPMSPRDPPSGRLKHWSISPAHKHGLIFTIATSPAVEPS